MTITEIVNAKIKLLVDEGKVTSTDIEIATAEVNQAIRNYCNIEQDCPIPLELDFVVANMVVDLVRYTTEINTAAAVAISDVDSSEVSVLKIGDTQVTLGGASGTNQRAKALKAHGSGLDNITMNYSAQLNRFRRMVW